MRFARTLWLMVATIFLLVMIPVGIILALEFSDSTFIEEDILVIAIIAVCMIAALVMPGFFILNWMHKKRVLANGIPAEARVIRSEATGVRINDCPVYELYLDVRPHYDQAFETVTEYCASTPYGEPPAPGSRITVFWVEGTKEIAVVES